MEIFLLIVTLLILTGWIIRQHRNSRSQRMPPGPLALPFVGNLLQTRSGLHIKAMEWRQYYGNTLLCYLGKLPLVIMHDYEMVKKVFNEDITTGRDQGDFFLQVFNKGAGLVCTEGDIWKQHRRFAITTLRDFGMGRASLEHIILDEIDELCLYFKKFSEQPVDPKMALSHSVSNIICALIFGQRFAHQDEQFTRLTMLIAENFEIVGYSYIYRMLPFMKYCPGKFRQNYETICHNARELTAFFKEMIHKHRKNVMDSGGVNDYLDAYMKEGNDPDNDDKISFSEDQLVGSIFDLFGAGTETTTTTILWAMVYLVENPDVMRKMQAEIDQYVDKVQPVRMEQKAVLPYTEAVILEVQRLASLVPLSLFHQAMDNMEIGGYQIPKGTLLAPNIYSIHRDERYWKNPNQFDPAHFLDGQGKVVRLPGGFLPFGIGKRTCMGESLARMELFLFIANLVKNFTLTNMPRMKVSHEDVVNGIVLQPKTFELLFVPRVQ